MPKVPGRIDPGGWACFIPDLHANCMNLMDPHIASLSPLRTMPKTIEAACYNQVRIALLRLGIPLRVALPEHRGLEIILENDYWLCVDSAFDDLPIMAWLDFDTRGHNNALHEPVPCELRLYHTHAGLVMGSALDAMQKSLADRLSDRETT